MDEPGRRTKDEGRRTKGALGLNTTFVIRPSSFVVRQPPSVLRPPQHLDQRIAPTLTIGEPGQRGRVLRTQTIQVSNPTFEFVVSLGHRVGGTGLAQTPLQIGQRDQPALGVLDAAGDPAVRLKPAKGCRAQLGGQLLLGLSAGCCQPFGRVAHFDQSTASCLRPLRCFSTAMPATAPSAAATTACLT